MDEIEKALLVKQSEGWLLQKATTKEYASLVPIAVDEGKIRSLDYYLGFDRALMKVAKLTSINSLPSNDGTRKAWALMSGYCAFRILEKLSK